MSEFEYGGNKYKFKGNGNNFGIINKYGLDETEVERLIVDNTKILLDEVKKTGNAITQEIVDKVAAYSENKIFGAIYRLEGKIDDLEKSFKDNFAEAKENGILTQDWLREFSVALKNQGTDIKDQQNLLKVLSQKVDASGFETQKLYGQLLGKISDINQSLESLLNDRLDAKKKFIESVALDFEIAESRLKSADFDGAEQKFKEILNRINSNLTYSDNYTKAKACFGLAMAECKIQIVWDYVYDRLQPVLHNFNLHTKISDGETIIDNAYFTTAIKLAGDKRQAFKGYKDKLDKIYRYYVNYIKDSRYNYDCFICVKKSEIGNYKKNTDDFKWVGKEDAQKNNLLCSALKRRGLKPFYFDIDCTEEMKNGDEGLRYEAFIAYALHKSLCLILVCSDQDYLGTPWVKNEYVRFCETLNSKKKQGTPENNIIVITNGADIRLPAYVEDDIECLDRKKFVSYSPSPEGYWNLDDLAETVARRIKKSNFKPKPQPVRPQSGQKIYKPEPETAAAGSEPLFVKTEDYVVSTKKPSHSRRFKYRFKRTAAFLKRHAGIAIITAVLTVTAIVLLSLIPVFRSLTATEIIDTYYLYSGGEYNYDKSISLKTNYKWEDGEGVSGKYETDGNGIILFGPDDENEYARGIVENGVLKVNINEKETVYVTENHNHSYGTWTITVRATCVSGGEQKRTCLCGNTELEPVPATGHSFSDKICLECGVTQLDYKKYKDYVEVTGGGSDVTEIVIPETVDGLPVKSIGAKAFINCTYLASITIPDSVTSISYSAFEGCSSLTSITIHDSVTFISYSAFDGCSALTIYFEATEKPSGWLVSCPVVWDCDNNDEDENGYVYRIVGGLRYKIKNREATVTGQPSNLKKAEIPSYIYLEKIYDIYSIEDNAFKNCVSLTKISIPYSVKSIGENAIAGCGSLEEITVAASNANFKSENNCLLSKDGETLLYGCKNSVIPDGVTTIAYGAFYNCSSLTSIIIPDSVTSIGISAFEDCSSLISIIIPDGVTTIGDSAFNGCSALESIVLPVSVTAVGREAFYNCSSLKSITVPAGVTSVGVSAFRGTAYYKDETNWTDGVLYIGNCLIIADISLPAGYVVKQGTLLIADRAFSDCKNLLSVTFPASLKNIGDGAFDGCNRLIEVCNLSSLEIVKNSTENGYAGYYARHIISSTHEKSALTVTDDDFIFYQYEQNTFLLGYRGDKTELNLPKNFNGKTYAIYGYAFKGLKDIVKITAVTGVSSIKDYAFSGCSSLTDFDMGDGVKSIGESAFKNCGALKNVILSEGLTSIGDSAFWYCTSLTELNLPDSVSEIGPAAFLNCRLTSFKIPDSVKSVNYMTFWDNYNLESIYIPSGVTAVASDAFNFSRKIKFVYYNGTVEDWAKLNFKDNEYVNGKNIYYYSETKPVEIGNYWRFVDGKPEVWQQI